MIEKFKKITSAHWLLIIGIVFAFIAGQWSSDSGLVSHLSLAASVVSIVLAIIAIFYTIDRNSSAEEQIGRMNGILHNLEKASGRLEEKGEAMHKATKNILGTQSIEAQKETEKTTEENPETLGLSPNLKDQLIKTSLYGLLCLNWIAKAKKSVKASSIKIIQEKLGLENDIAYYLRGYCLGTNVNLVDFDISADEDSLIARAIPEDFETLLNEAISERLKESSDMKDWMEKQLEITDKYFDD
jgi:hypothetical protein